MPRYRYRPAVDGAGRLVDLAFTVSQVAGLIGIHVQTAYGLVKRGELRCVRAGRRVLIPRSSVEAFLGDAIPQEREPAAAVCREVTRGLRGRFSRPDRL